MQEYLKRKIKIIILEQLIFYRSEITDEDWNNGIRPINDVIINANNFNIINYPKNKLNIDEQNTLKKLRKDFFIYQIYKENKDLPMHVIKNMIRVIEKRIDLLMIQIMNSILMKMI